MTVEHGGALVISLDFELHWGVRDRVGATGPYRANLLGARLAVLEMLDIFEEFGVAATWATVGFLFARNKSELERFTPRIPPHYHQQSLDPYGEAIGETEKDDPLHYAPSLLEKIRRSPGQEIASHTFSHYYCLEPGQTREMFEADLDSAVSIAREHGIRLRSVVFPRNQWNPAYADILVRKGITAYRGNARGWMYRSTSRNGQTHGRRALRLLDSYVSLSGPNLISWEEVPQSGGVADVRASAFLRPYNPRLSMFDHIRLARIEAAMETAARTQSIFHLWWHPHNFGRYLPQNLQFLRQILKAFVRARNEWGMKSLTMSEVAELASQPDQLAMSATPR